MGAYVDFRGAGAMSDRPETSDLDVLFLRERKLDEEDFEIQLDEARRSVAS